MLARHLMLQAARRPSQPGSAASVSIAELARLVTGEIDSARLAAGDGERDTNVLTTFSNFSVWLEEQQNPLGYLRRALGLTAIDLGILTVLLAPELDPEFVRGYAAAMDDFTRKRADIGFVARLIAGSDDDLRLRVLARFNHDAPLRLMRLIAVGSGDELAPIGLRPTRVTDRFLNYVQGDLRLDERVAAWCHATYPADAPTVPSLVLPPRAVAAVEHAFDNANHGQLRLLLAGRPGTGRGRLVTAVVGARGGATLRIDLKSVASLVFAGSRADELFALALREVIMLGGVALFDGDELPSDLPPTFARALTDAIATATCPVVLVLDNRPTWLASSLPDLIEFEMPPPTFAERVELWRRNVPEDLDNEAVELVASRYSFTAASIVQAARRAFNSARMRPAAEAKLTLDDVSDAARLSFGHRLGAVAQRIPTGFKWDDLVLPPDTASAVKEVIRFARRRPFLLEQWGFAKKLPYGRGVSAILAGPPGTGKTMVAQLLANELGYDLYRIDLSQVVNKYIGETEKNLARIFNEAETSHAVLFFDEADSLFAKRTEVKSSNDRYANLEVNYLLQRMETFDGVTLLATNLEQGLDEAFKRRVRFSVQFELPEFEERRRLWRSMFPPETPLDPVIDWDLLGKTFVMAGGYIKKAAVRAALIAADAEPRRSVSTADMMQAAREEYREMGRIVAG